GLEPFRHHAGSSEGTFLALGDRHGERLCPSRPEIHVDRATTLADRPHLAFDQSKTAALARKLRPAFGCHDDIIRFAPEAKLSPPRRPFLPQKLVGAGAIADMGGNARESFRYHLVCDRARLPGDSGEGNGAAVAIGERTVLTKLHRSIREHRLQRRAGRKTS